jgi:O-antigen/teichoic acid export membrane protein
LSRRGADLAAARRHAGSVFWLGLAETAARLSGVAIQILVARALAPDLYGKFSSAYSLFLVLVPTASLGLRESFIRDGAIERERMPEVLSDYFSLRLVSAAATLAATVVLAWLQRPELYIVLGIGVYMTVRSVTQFLATAFRALERFNREFTIRLGESVLLLAAVGGAWAAGAGLSAFVGILTAAAALYLAGLMVAYRAVLPGFHLRVPRSVVRRVLKAVPLGLPSLSTFALLRADVFLLERVGGSARAAGEFAAAVNLILGLSLGPWLVATALYPALSRGHRELRSRRRLLAGLVAGFVVLGAALAAGCALAAPLLLRAAYGSRYVGVAPLLRRLSPFLIALSPGVFAATVLAAREERRAIVLATVAPLGAGILAGAAVIPVYSGNGLAVSATIFQALLALIGSFFVLRTKAAEEIPNI